jgi:hypothetical protein
VISSFRKVSRGSKRPQTSTKSSSLIDGFNSDIQKPLFIVMSTLKPFTNRSVGKNLASLFKMSGRGGINNGSGGQGRGGANRSGCSR